MSDDRVRESLRVDRSVRDYAVRWGPESRLPPAECLRHSTNLRAIPASASLARSVDGLRAGQIVQMRDELVDALRDDGARIATSPTDQDTGAVECEVVLVEPVAVTRR
jgi:hypothetical protein